MRIAVIASPVTPLLPAQAGGAQSLLTDLAIALRLRGHEVTLYCAEGSVVDGVELFTVPAPADAHLALVQPAGTPPPPAPGVTAAFESMFAAVKRKRPDAISQHAFDVPAFSLSKDLPVLHTLHLPPIVPAVVAAAAAAPARELATVSKACRRSWLVAGVEVGHVIRDGVADIDTGDPAVEPAALIAGRLSPEKGIGHALRAAGAAGLRVRVAGAVYDPGYEVDLDGAERLGSLPRVELRRVTAGSAVTVCAARWEEPFGLVAAEAQMAGCPVAAYRRGGLPEVIEDGVSGVLAQPDDVDDLAAAIRRCLSLDRAAVRASARRRLALEPVVEAYEKTLSEVAR